MKILIYGAGVIGCTYGWQLSKAGHDITLLVRKEKKSAFEKEGITIHCTDFRKGHKHTENVVFKPEVIDELSSDNDFEYIIVPTNSIYISAILPVLSSSAGNAHILFFQNIWDDFDEIEKWLSPEQYFFGFPFMVGGGKNAQEINCAISGMKYSHTLLGELDGKITPRVQKMMKAMNDIELKPLISSDIKNWLITHYAVAASLSAGILKAGGGKKFAINTLTLKETIKSIRESLKICEARGIDSRKDKSNRLYYLPLFIAIPIAKKVYSNEALILMFDGHTEHSPEEIKKMLEDIIQYGRNYNLNIPNLLNLWKHIN